MKRAGHLIEKIAETSNLELAFYRAAKGKREKLEVIEYNKNLYENLFQLKEQILNNKLQVGNYNYFTIYDPKKRIICAAPFPQRVLHHALMNICHPHFERKQIFDSYATRLGKGTFAALDRAFYLNQKYKWFLKLDFRKYFDSIDHAVLNIQLRNLFKDKLLLNYFDLIIDSYSVSNGKGVPIGNLTSQYFANLYLAKADHYAWEELKIPCVRYMDDVVLWANDKDILLKAGNEYKLYTEENLQLVLKPFCLNRNEKGLPFLSFLLFPNEIKLAHRSRIRFIKKLKKYHEHLESSEWTQKEFQNHITPLIEFTRHANANAFRKKILQNMN
jgi:retron-type reverse transcriptase